MPNSNKKQASERSGVQPRTPPAWLMVFAIIAILALSFALAIFASSKATAVSVFQAILGGVFAISGIIVAAVAVLTQLSFKESLRSEASRLEKEVHEAIFKFQEENRQQIHQYTEKINSIFMIKAVDLVNVPKIYWPQRIRAGERAWKIDPGTADALVAPALGVDLTEVCRTYHWAALSGGIVNEDLNFVGPGPASFPAGRIRVVPQTLRLGDYPALEALEYLQRYIQWRKGQSQYPTRRDLIAGACLAEIYGFLGSFDKMIDQLRQLMANFGGLPEEAPGYEEDPPVRSDIDTYLRAAPNVAMYCRACQGRVLAPGTRHDQKQQVRDQLKQLASILQLDFPLDEAEKLRSWTVARARSYYRRLLEAQSQGRSLFGGDVFHWLAICLNAEPFLQLVGVYAIPQDPPQSPQGNPEKIQIDPDQVEFGPPMLRWTDGQNTSRNVEIGSPECDQLGYLLIVPA